MQISIIGTGYVGLVTGTCFAEMGNDVLCVDIDVEKVAKLSHGTLTIFEPGLGVLFERNRREGRLDFTTDLARAVEHGQVIFLALPTPPYEDGSADLQYVLDAATSIGKLLSADRDSGYRVIVNKSTVPVGTADRVRALLQQQELMPGADFDVVSNPEFLREGVAVDDFMKPERIVIGSDSERASSIMKTLYKPFVRQGNPILIVDERSAEMIKYAANAFLATKISFMNEMANLCEGLGANVDRVRHGIGLDSRIGKQFLFPGLGFGGSCFPKDVQALAHMAKSKKRGHAILEAVLQVNEGQRTRFARRIIDHFDGSLEGKRIAVWGLSFKPNTDDIREAPAHTIIPILQAHGAGITVFDPVANHASRVTLGENVIYAGDSYSALEGADALVICTEWNEFRRPDFRRMQQLLRSPILFDGRNLYDPREMAELGFSYHSIGRLHFSPVRRPIERSHERSSVIQKVV